MSKMFGRGYKEVKDEKVRQDKARESRQSKLWRFFVTEEEGEAEGRFLTEEPVNFNEHTLKSMKNGKEHYDYATCTGEDCEYCADDNRPTFKGAYLFVDRREVEVKGQDGKKKKIKDQVRLFVQGTRVLSQLDRISTKYGLSNRDVTIVRMGSSTNTVYTVEKGDEDKLTKKEIEALLPEFLRKKYDGTMESLYKIVEEQLEPAGDKIVSDDKEDDEEDDNRDKLIEAEDDEETPPKKPSILSGKKKIGIKPKENSIKKRTSILDKLNDEDIPF